MDRSGNFASSTYYMQSHPAWGQRYQSARPQDRYYGKTWTPLLADSAYAADADDRFHPPTVSAPHRVPFTWQTVGGRSSAASAQDRFYHRRRCARSRPMKSPRHAHARSFPWRLARAHAAPMPIVNVDTAAHVPADFFLRRRIAQKNKKTSDGTTCPTPTDGLIFLRACKTCRRAMVTAGHGASAEPSMWACGRPAVRALPD